MKTRIVTIRDNVTRTLHAIERPKPRFCDRCGLGLAPAQTTETCPRCKDYVARLKADRAALTADLAGACTDPTWRQDREEALAWTERELIRLGHGGTV